MQVRKYTYRDAFGPEFPADWEIEGFEPAGCRFVPEPDPLWEWDPDVLRDISMWWEHGRPDGLLLFGDTGAGKSGALRQFCACLNIPLYFKTINERVDFEDLVKAIDVIDGNTLPSYQHLPLAMGAEGEPGIFLANELDFADPNTVGGLHDLLDGAPLLVPMSGLAPVMPHPRFRIAGTANTALMGDPTGQYAGTRPQNIAFSERFWKVRVPYLSVEAEKRILARVAPDLPEVIRNDMIKVANVTREKFMGQSSDTDALPMPITTRALKRWAALSWHFRGAKKRGRSPVYYALDRAYANVYHPSPETYTAVKQIAIGILGDNPLG